MADYIAVNSTADFVAVRLNADGADYDSNVSVAFDGAGSANVLNVPSLQDLTISSSPGLFRWQQLDELSEKVVTTPSTNSVSMTLVLDPVSFFTGANSSPGIFNITKNKTETYFRVYFQGTGSGDRYIQGKGYLSALAPTTSATSPVWTSPVTIEVIGDFSNVTTV